MFSSKRELQAGYDPLCVVCSSVLVPSTLMPCSVQACLLACSKLPIDSVCHGLAQGPRRVAFVCSQPCPVSICCWDGLQCCHHPNQNKWTFVCCLLLNLSVYVPQKIREKIVMRVSCCTFAEVKNRAIIRNMEL